MEKEPRVILKLTGELFGDDGDHINFKKYDEVAQTLIEIRKQTPVQLAMVVGGGNIFRGREANPEVNHVSADFMGMLATVQNGIGLREALVRNGQKETRLMTAFNLPAMAEPYIYEKAIHHLNSGKMIILAGGLGIPGFSTDTTLATRGIELQCHIALKASTVDGIYDQDPRKNPDAKRFQRITFTDVVGKKLKVMDSTAFTLCWDANLPIFVFDISQLSRIPEVIEGNYSFGTLVTNES